MQDDPEYVSLWEPPVYPDETHAPIRYLAVRGEYGYFVREQGTIGFLWASSTNDAAGFLPVVGAGQVGTEAARAWLFRLRRSTEVRLTPLQALRFWIGRGWDGSGPNPGSIASDEVEQDLPDLRTLRMMADPSGELAAAAERRNEERQRQDRAYSTNTPDAVRFAPVRSEGEVLGFLWAAINDRAAYFIEDNRNLATRAAGLDAGIRWRRRFREAAAEGVTPQAFLLRWADAASNPDEPEAGTVSSSEVEDAVSLLTVLHRAGIPIDPDAGLAGPLRIPGVNVPVPEGRYRDFTFAPLRAVTIWRDGRIMGYLWAGIDDDDAAGFQARTDTHPDSQRAAMIWFRRLDWAKTQNMTSLQAMRHWIGVAADPGESDAGTIPADAAELHEPHQARLAQRARQFVVGDERRVASPER